MNVQGLSRRVACANDASRRQSCNGESEGGSGKEVVRTSVSKALRHCSTVSTGVRMPSSTRALMRMRQSRNSGDIVTVKIRQGSP